ncbi:MAG: response regulator transcription factor, partial [Acidaminobacteraceae bacterium]
MTTKTTRILIADDHSLIRQGLKTIIEFQETLSVVCECDNGVDAISNMKLLKPDVAIIDVNMPGKTGLEVLEEAKIAGLKSKIIMLTVESDRKTLMSAIEFGADGFILKDSDAKDILDAVYEVVKGENYIDKRLVKLLIYDLKHKVAGHNDELLFSELTNREFDVLELISRGMTNAEIA